MSGFLPKEIQTYHRDDKKGKNFDMMKPKFLSNINFINKFIPTCIYDNQTIINL